MNAERGQLAPVSMFDTTDEPSVFGPHEWIRHCEIRTGRTAPVLPDGAVQLLLSKEVANTLTRFGVDADDFPLAGHPFAVVDAEPGQSAISWSAKGSSAAGGIDELIALGARSIVVVGSAGALTDTVNVGDVVVASAGLRDDGVSHHYEPPARYSYPSQSLTERLAATATEHGLVTRVGPMTAYYRQTMSRLRAFRDEGCIAVCNEAAAAFAVGNHRGVEVAYIGVVGDSLAEGRFEAPPEFPPETVTTMVDVALQAVTKTPEQPRVV